jgi:hypothetical protein
MTTRRFTGVLLLAAAVTATTAAQGQLHWDTTEPGRQGAYAIGLWGDLPYSDLQASVGVPNLIADMNTQDLAWMCAKIAAPRSFLKQAFSLQVRQFARCVQNTEGNREKATASLTVALTRKRGSASDCVYVEGTSLSFSLRGVVAGLGGAWLHERGEQLAQQGRARLHG